MAAAGKDEAGAAAAAAHQRQDKLQQMYGAWRSKFAEVRSCPRRGTRGLRLDNSGPPGQASTDPHAHAF